MPNEGDMRLTIEASTRRKDVARSVSQARGSHLWSPCPSFSPLPTIATVLFTAALLAFGLVFKSAGWGWGPAWRQSRSSGPAPTVTVKNGTYFGVRSPQYNQEFFLGMPFAQKAIRFTIAQPLNATWSGVNSATEYPPYCVGYGDDNIGYPSSEDCLYLNVIRPAGIKVTAGLPVAVYIHGGGLFMGGSADRRYNLSFIVQNSVENGTPILGVSINYRVSVFGFLQGKQALEAGLTNIGFRDQRLALSWVSENIAAFGGDPSKVTIWGESSGAESVSAQVLAYNGRDDKLFRGAIAQSGFGGYLARYPGGLNNTTARQSRYNDLVTDTSCAPMVNTLASIECLRNLPFDDINAALNGTFPFAWPPVLDNDFVADFPTNQLSSGKFVHVPIMIGTNTDEGTAFGSGSFHGLRENTDAEMAAAVAGILGPGAPEVTGKSADELVNELLLLYLDIQAVGIPSLETYPEVITTGSARAEELGLQYRRTGALFGDFFWHYTRRRASIAWSNAGLPSYSYRFNVVPNGIPAFIGSSHFQEVAFVFHNLAGDGYGVNPFANVTAAYPALAKTMSLAWVNFVTSLNPNGAKGLDLPHGANWPAYNIADGGGVGRNVVWDVNGSYVEWDAWRTEGINWMVKNSLAVFGI